MREYILHQAEFRDRAFAFPWLRRAIRNWRSRRTLAKLEQFEDHILFDIGLSRAELRAARRLPWDVDPIADMQRSRDTRAVRGRRHK